ncbi:MAG: hypothetical protein Q8K85_03175, partial [Hyphomicrobium sp.]|nr:hypothetical protein [Hyphomicrobium sp.]
MSTPQCPRKIVRHPAKGQLQRCLSANKHIIMSGTITWVLYRLEAGKPPDFLHSAADPVAH